MTAPGRFSFNQATAKYWALPELVEGCLRAGVRGVGLWREPVAEYGLGRAAALVHESGLAVTSLCRGGFFNVDGWWDDNRRAVDEAAALGTDVLILVAGGLPAGCRDLVAARERVAESVGRLAPYAADAGVTLAVEPLHPMYCADRCVVNTIAQALRVVSAHPVGVAGVVVDTYHVWWDDRVYDDIEAAGDRIAAFQIADWVTPLPSGVLTGRALPGAGCIDLRRLHGAVAATGFSGPIEVEVFNESLWSRPGAEILADAIAGYRRALEREPVD